jgi:hypothetical protein
VIVACWMLASAAYHPVYVGCMTHNVTASDHPTKRSLLFAFLTNQA